jgi:hypothetical protein
MSVLTFSQAPRDATELAVWSFSHMAHHRDIIRIIFQITGIQLNEFILDPFDPREDDSWVAQHQVMHQQMDGILGIVSYDLSVLDWSDPSGLASWMESNRLEHDQASLILNF